MAVSVATPYPDPDRIVPVTAAERLVTGPDTPFILDMVQCAAGTAQQVEGKTLWFVPLAGTGTIDGESWRQGECWLIEGDATIAADMPMSAMLARLP
jgi:mannose-6-phosphate isomerase